jgi:hypothetical protein
VELLPVLPVHQVASFRDCHRIEPVNAELLAGERAAWEGANTLPSDISEFDRARRKD